MKGTRAATRAPGRLLQRHRRTVASRRAVWLRPGRSSTRRRGAGDSGDEHGRSGSRRPGRWPIPPGGSPATRMAFSSTRIARIVTTAAGPSAIPHRGLSDRHPTGSLHAVGGRAHDQAQSDRCPSEPAPTRLAPETSATGRALLGRHERKPIATPDGTHTRLWRGHTLPRHKAAGCSQYQPLIDWHWLPRGEPAGLRLLATKGPAMAWGS